MDEGHGIMSLDIIPVLIRIRPKGEKFLQRIMHIPWREHVGTSADLPSYKRENNFIGKSCA